MTGGISSPKIKKVKKREPITAWISKLTSQLAKKFITLSSSPHLQHLSHPSSTLLHLSWLPCTTSSVKSGAQQPIWLISLFICLDYFTTLWALCLVQLQCPHCSSQPAAHMSTHTLCQPWTIQPCSHLFIFFKSNYSLLCVYVSVTSTSGRFYCLNPILKSCEETWN